jgi:hypothetical protein
MGPKQKDFPCRQPGCDKEYCTDAARCKHERNIHDMSGPRPQPISTIYTLSGQEIHQYSASDQESICEQNEHRRIRQERLELEEDSSRFYLFTKFNYPGAMAETYQETPYKIWVKTADTFYKNNPSMPVEMVVQQMTGLNKMSFNEAHEVLMTNLELSFPNLFLSTVSYLEKSINFHFLIAQ